MPGFAVLLGLAAAACCYLAAPNQVLTRRPRSPAVLCLLALGLTIACAWVWSVPHGWPTAIAAALVTVTFGLSVWPFVGTWLNVRRERAQGIQGARGAQGGRA